MTTIIESLPLTDTIAPGEQAGVAEAIRQAAKDRTAVYPIGGGTSLDYGIAARQPGLGLSLKKLDRVVDYPARDMTITVEAGVTMAALAETLGSENQWLPIEVPRPELSTIGGVVATAWCGPRRYGAGTVRDYVIGISAVDGQGLAFKGGGRVVKNVAGYDFCKLLTGLLGALGAITQVTFKITPRPRQSVLLACDVADWLLAERLLAAMVHTTTTPSAIELLAGPQWASGTGLGGTGLGGTELDATTPGAVARLVVGLEGSAAEVDWMLATLKSEWQSLGIERTQSFADEAAAEFWTWLRDFSALDDAAPLVLKAALRPSATVEYVKLLQAVDPQVSIQAHAGSGIVIARFAQFGAGDISQALIGKLQPAATAAHGQVVVLSSSGLGELTRQAVWGGSTAAGVWMQKVKQQFDPYGLLSPGRFVYA